VPLLVLAGAVLAYALRLETWTTERPRFLMLPTHLRFDSLFFGVGLAYGWHHHREAMEAWILPRRRALGLAGALLLVPCAVMPLAGDFTVNTLGLTFNYLGFGALLLVALTAPGEPAGLTRALARMGYFSYSIYLWHMPVNTAVRAWIEPSLGHLAGMACYLVGSVAVGILMARLVELPMLRLRDRLLPSRSAAAPAAALAGAALP
jgi:peptidoglycan/LPS O-acetylase OafA/YrhL